MIERTLRYGSAPIYGFHDDAMQKLLGEIPGCRVIRAHTHRYFDDAMQTDIECAIGDARVTTYTMTNCGLECFEVVVRAESVATIDAVVRDLDAAMARHGFPRRVASAPPVAPTPPKKSEEIVVAEPPDAELLPGERTIIDLIIAGRVHRDADEDGGHRTFSFRDGRFVQVYGSHAYPNSDGEVIYAGPKAFLRDLLATCAYERARASTTEEFLEAVRRSITG